MRPIVSVLSGVGVTGGVVGGGFLINSFISKDISKITLQDYFVSKGQILISSLDDAKENRQWNEEFTLDQTEIKKYDDQITNGEKLKNWCQNNLKLEKEKNEVLIPYLEKWCLLGTIESRVSRIKDKELVADTNSGEWSRIYNEHTEEEKRVKVGLTGTKDQNTGKQDSDIKAIKSFCVESKKKTFLAEEREKVYDVVIQWCTRNKASSPVSTAS